MKVKDLIGVLQACNPESEVLCKWRGDSESDIDYRYACSWLVADSVNSPIGRTKGCDALDIFSTNGANLEAKEDGLVCLLSIDQVFFKKAFIRDTIKELKEKENAEL